MKNVLVTGGAGYVGSALVPKLLDNYKVSVYDLFLYGDPFEHKGRGRKPKNLRNLKKIKADIRDENKLRKAMKGIDKVIHLACISNDPSFELNPALSKKIDHYGARRLVDIAEEERVEHFIYASSSSVYGIRPEFDDVKETTVTRPLTDYSRCKLGLEQYLQNKKINWTILRPATICGYAPRLRLDTVVNLLTAQALINNKITVFGGNQYRAHLNIEDMVNAYLSILDTKTERINHHIFNVSHSNMKVSHLAELIFSVLERQVNIETIPTNDPRSYRLNGEKITKFTKFSPSHRIEDAILSIRKAYENGIIGDDALDNPLYHNVKMMKMVDLQ